MASLLAFTAEQVSTVTGLSKRQVRYWDRTGFFSPQYSRDARRFGRVYSFKDVVGLRTVAKLRGRLPLQELRRIGTWLRDRYDEPWSELHFYVIGRKVLFEDQEGIRAVAGTGQEVFPIWLSEVVDETDQAARSLTERAPNQIGKIVRNRYVQHNAWVIDGTRIPTSAIWHFHADGYRSDEILREYPRLTERDVAEAIDFERNRRHEVAS